MKERTALARHLHGVLTALITPFDRDGELDLRALDDHIDFQVREGTSAIVVGGGIGEYGALTLSERRLLAERAVTAAAGRTAVLVGVTHQRPAAVHDLAAHAAAAGADGLLVSTPPLLKLDDGELRDFWTRLNDTVTLPWVFYAATDAKSGPPPLELIDEIAELSRIAGYTEPSPDPHRLRETLRIAGDRIPVIAAAEVILPEAFTAGAPACMTSTACFAPSQLRQLQRAAIADDAAGVTAAYAPIRAFRNCFEERMAAGYPAYISFTKAACDFSGLASGPPRPPLRLLSPQQTARLHSTLLEHGLSLHSARRAGHSR